MEKSTLLRRLAAFYVHLFAIAVLGGIAFAFFGSLMTNPYTPAGHEGYVYEEPRLFGEGGFCGAVSGPGHFGASLANNQVVNVNLRPTSFRETVSAPTAAGTVRLGCATVLRVVPGSVQRVVEEFGGEAWYNVTVQHELVRAIQQTVASHSDAHSIAAPAALEGDARALLNEALAQRSAPFAVDSLVILDFDLPDHMRLRATDSPGFEIAKQGSANNPSDYTDGLVPVSSGAARSTPVVRIEVAHKREFRGVWLATVSNIDWPSTNELSVKKQKEELIETLDLVKQLNMNAVLLQVRGAGDAFYESKFEPWSAWLMGTEGKRPQPFYDPLAFAIEECHKRGIELHAWFNPYRAKTTDKYQQAETNVARVLKQYARPYGKQIWMDPGAKPVQDWILKVAEDVVSRYDIDGVVLDDYFYPYPEGGRKFPDDATYQEHLKCCGEIDRDDWRRQNIDTLISRFHRLIKATRPDVKFGVSPFGLYRPGFPENTKGLDQYTQIYADPKKWLERGWVDYIAPQLYWKESSNRSYSKVLTWWGENNLLRRHIYTANSLLSMERKNGNWPLSEFEGQVQASRDSANLQSRGNIFFGMRVFNSSRGESVKRKFGKEFYPTPALPPVMPWFEGHKPECPYNLRYEEHSLVWDAKLSEEVRCWTLYRQQEDKTWQLQEILAPSVSRFEVDAGVYALCAVDSMARESTGAFVVAKEPDDSEVIVVDSDKPSKKEDGGQN